MAKVPTWRWVVFIIFFVLCPIIFHPWWVAILSMFIFLLISYFLDPRTDSE